MAPRGMAPQGARKPRFRRIRVVTAGRVRYLAGKQSDETEP